MGWGETEAIIGKAPGLGIHTRGLKLDFQNTMPTSYAFSYVMTPLRGILRENNFIKFADMLCGGCDCVVEGGCMQGCCVRGRIVSRSRAPWLGAPDSVVFLCEWYSRSHLGWHFRMLFQSSKLKARTSLFTEMWQKRGSSFELWAFENVTPSGLAVKWIWIHECVVIRICYPFPKWVATHFPEMGSSSCRYPPA